MDLYDAIKQDLGAVKRHLASQPKLPPVKELLNATFCAEQAEIRHFLVSLATERKVKLANGMNDAHAAALSGDLAHLELALKRKAALDARIDEPSSVYNQLTPLHIAARFDNAQLAQALLDHGLPPEIESEYRRTPLHEALAHASEQTARLLVAAGAQVNAREALLERTPIFELSPAASPELVDFLANAGADLMLEDKYGEGIAASLLALAAIEPLKRLFALGLPLTFADGTNALFRSLAAYEGNHGYLPEQRPALEATLDWLLQRLDVNGVIDWEGRPQNLLELALKECSLHTVKHLLARGATLLDSFDAAVLGETGSDFPGKLKLLRKAGVDLPARTIAPAIVEKLASAGDKKEEAQLKELLVALASDEALGEARTAEGVDLLFHYVSLVLLNNGELNPHIVEMLLDAGVSAETEYSSAQATALAQLADESYNLPRDRYCTATLLKDLSADLGKRAQKLLASIEARIGPIPAPELGVGV